MRDRSYSRSRSPVVRQSRGYDRERARSPPPRSDRYDRRDYRNGDRDRGGDRYRDTGRSRYDDRAPRRSRNNDGRDNPRPSNCLGIFGMSSNTSERDLREIFERFGRVDSVKVIMDHGSGRSRGFGFVNFEDRADATKARDKISDTIIDGMKVRVDYAIQNRRTSPPRNRSPPARRYDDRSPIRRRTKSP
uniref:RRM domain-containing protein n=1 Tax=Panagrolaimus sp. PS1159 TaxID=55785 RepID=A0AC35F1S3_9BILA